MFARALSNLTSASSGFIVETAVRSHPSLPPFQSQRSRTRGDHVVGRIRTRIHPGPAGGDAAVYQGRPWSQPGRHELAPRLGPAWKPPGGGALHLGRSIRKTPPVAHRLWTFGNSQ